jgi:hypothetical protein
MLLNDLEIFSKKKKINVAIPNLAGGNYKSHKDRLSRKKKKII